MLIAGSVYETILATDYLETSPTNLSVNQLCWYFVMLCSELTGLRNRGSERMVKNDQPPAPLQRLEYVVEDRFWLSELVVGVRYQQGVGCTCLEPWVIWLSVDDMDIALISQECSYSQEQQRFLQNIHCYDAAMLTNHGTEFEREVPGSRAEINYNFSVLQGECLNYLSGALP